MGDRDDQDSKGGESPAYKTFLYHVASKETLKMFASRDFYPADRIREEFGEDIKFSDVVRVEVTKGLIQEANDEIIGRANQIKLAEGVSFVKKNSPSLAAELNRRATRNAIDFLMPALSDDPLAPPKNGQFVLSLVTSRETQEEIIGDLDERYPTKVLQLGEKRARFWYYWQTGLIVLAFIPKKLGKITGLVKLFAALKS